MAQRAGSADLPLHGGQVPKWLADRMTRLGTVMSQAIVHHYGRDELLRRLAHPFWFQSFGAVMGMDWHSSGITTSVIGALKRGLAPLSNELGIHVCDGRGKHSRQTPREVVAIGERVGFDGSALANASRLVAKVDSAAVQDGFDLYLHGFIVTNDGQWDLYLAPGSVGVEEDEHVDRPVASILAVIALALPRHGLDRLPYLTDELGRALVETDNRPLRIRRLRIQGEHILHASDVLAVDMRNAPPVLAPRLEVVFGQPTAHCLPG